MTAVSQVAVDVLSWVQAVDAVPSTAPIPMCGHFRHLTALCGLYHPAMLVEDDLGRRLWLSPAVKRLERHLKQPIRRYALDGPPQVWISSALDSHCPALGAWDNQCARLAILHDCAPVCTKLFPEKAVMFERGIKLHDVALPVTPRIWAQFQARFPQEKRLRSVAYGGFHTLEGLPAARKTARTHLLTVSNFYRYKGFPRSLELGRSLKLPVCFAGQRTKDYPASTYEAWAEEATVHGPADDAALAQLYGKAAVYALLSSEESFSLTPLEAILGGVPVLVLSHIAAHQELYGSLGANLVSPDGSLRLTRADLRPLVPRARELVFEQFHFSKVSEPLRAFVDSLIYQ